MAIEGAKRHGDIEQLGNSCGLFSELELVHINGQSCSYPRVSTTLAVYTYNYTYEHSDSTLNVRCPQLSWMLGTVTSSVPFFLIVWYRNSHMLDTENITLIESQYHGVGRLCKTLFTRSV